MRKDGIQFVSKQADISALSRYNTTVYKGVAIFCVIICHFMGRFGRGITWFTPLGGIGVAIFLALSGFGLTVSWQKSGHKAWWRKRFLSTFLPYIIIQAIVYWPFHEFSFTGFLLDITLIIPRYINGWYLTYLLMWYIAFYIVMRIPLLRRYKMLIFSVLSIASFIAFAKSEPLRAEQSVSFLFGVLLAYFVQENRLNKLIKMRFAWLFLGVGVAVLAIKQLSFVRNSNEYIYSLVELFIKLPCAIGVMILVYHVVKRIKLKPIYWVGMISFELYIIHGYVLEQVPITALGAFLFILITSVASTLYWFVLDKTKKYQNKILRI